MSAESVLDGPVRAAGGLAGSYFPSLLLSLFLHVLLLWRTFQLVFHYGLLAADRVVGCASGLHGADLGEQCCTG